MLATEALKIFGCSLEPCVLCRFATVSKKWNGVIYELWQNQSYDTRDNRLAIARIYTQLANERLKSFWMLPIEHTITELKGRLCFPANVFSTKELILRVSNKLSKFVSTLDNTFINNTFADENTVLELKLLAQANPNIEKFIDFLLLTFDHTFDTIAIYQAISDKVENVSENPQEIDLNELISERMRAICQFLNVFLATDFWADLLAHKLETNKSLIKEVWLLAIKRVIPPILREKSYYLFEPFTISEIKSLTAFYSSKEASSILEKLIHSKISENNIEQNLIEIVETALPLKKFIHKDDMHEIIPGLFLGNRTAAGLDDCSYKNSIPEVIKQFLKSHQITHIICLSNFQKQVYPSDFTYKLIPIKDDPCHDISVYFESTFEWIDQALTSGKKVLVHCDVGVSRSASIVIAYLMRKNQLGYNSAFEAVQKKRSFINPNPGFEWQLREYQEKIKNRQ